MKPEPSPSSDGRRLRRPLGPAEEKRIADTMEGDLWDLDEAGAPAKPSSPAPSTDTETPTAGEAGEENAPASIPVSPRSTKRDLTFKQSPAKSRDFKKKTDSSAESASSAAEQEPEADFSKKINSSTTVDRRPVDDAFDDLESSLANHPGLDEDTAADPAIHASHADPVPLPGTPPPRLLPSGLSKIERIGLVAFLVLLVAGSIFFLAYSINKLPEEQKYLTPGDLPIKGTRIEAVKIESYWREPVASGPQTDTVRRGTLLLPVVELGLSGGPGAVRIFFRNSEGATVGDGVTRPVNGPSTLTIPATAGFEDAGMFAAYRTGDSKPWFIEIHEGPSVNAAGSDFKKLFEIPISTHRR